MPANNSNLTSSNTTVASGILWFKKAISHCSVVHTHILSNVKVLYLLGLLIFIALAILSSSPTHAINEQFSFQGRLRNSSQGIVPDGDYHIRFRIYSGGDGNLGGGDETLEWTEAHSTGNLVRVENGYFTVQLGSITSLSSVDFTENTLWLSVDIGGTGGSASYDGEMDPFMRFSSTPYAFQSKAADQLKTSSGGNTGTLSFAGVTNDPVIALPDESGTVCLTSGNCAGSGGNGDVLQGGNSFTADMTIGTNDNYAFNIETNTVTRLTFSNTGTLTLPGFNCTGNANGGALTADASGVVSCSDDEGGGASGAPSTSQYLTLALDGGLSGERLLNPGSSLTVTDNGANGNYDINTIQDIRTTAGPTFATINTGNGDLEVNTIAGYLGDQNLRSTDNVSFGNVTATDFLCTNCIDAGALNANSVDSSELVNGSVDESHLNVTNAENSGYILSSNGSGAFTWIANTGGSCASCATTALDNLASTDINAALNTTAGNLNLTTTTSGNIVLNSAATIELQDNTNVTGNLDVSGTLTSGTANAFSVNSSGVITAGAYQGTSIADAYVDNNITISSTGSVNSLALTDGGTIGFDWVDAEIADTLTIGASSTVADGALSSNVTLQGNTFNGINQLVQLNASGNLPALNASLLTNLNGTNIASGTVANARLVGSGALTVTAGTGLANGGSVALGGSTTLNVGGGTCITANANDVAVTADCIDDAQIADNSIDATSLAANSVDSSELVNGSVDESHLNVTNAENSGYILSSNGSGAFTWIANTGGSCASCATTALDNLASTDINAALNTTAGNLNLTTTTSGNIVLNSAATIELQDNTNVTGNLTAADAGTGQTSDSHVISSTNAGSTFNTTAGQLQSIAGFFNSTSTRSAGANNLTNIGVYGTASGAQRNWAGVFEGNVNIGALDTSIGNTNAPQLLVRSDGENARIRVLGTNGERDAYISFGTDNDEVNDNWSIGLDDDDSDKFKISGNSSLGTNDYFVINAAGAIDISGAVTAGDFLCTNCIDAGALNANSVDSSELVNGSIDEGHLNVSNGPTNGWVLTANGTSFTWVDPSTFGGTTYSAGNDLDLSGSTFNIEPQLDFVTTISRASSNLTLQTTTSGNIVLNSADSIDLQDDTSIAGQLDIGSVGSPAFADLNVYGSSIDVAQFINNSGNSRINIGSHYIESSSTQLNFTSDVYIANNGNTSIGSSDTSFAKLYVNGNSFLEGPTAVENTSSSAFYVQNTSGDRILTAHTDTMQVGIGTGSPVGKLEIDTDPGENMTALVVDQEDTTHNPIALRVSNAGTGNSLQINTDEFVVDGVGHVGIGAAPSSLFKLDIQGVGTTGEAQNARIRLERSDDSDGLADITFAPSTVSAGKPYFELGLGSAADHFNLYSDDGVNTYNPFRAETDGDVSLAEGALFVDNSTGNVGIGETNPQFRLHVADTVAGNFTSFISDNLDTGANSDNRMIMRLTGTDDVTSGAVHLFAGKEQSWTGVASTRDSYFAIYTRENNSIAEKLRVSSAGNVGIGTNNPAAALHVLPPDQSTLEAAGVDGLDVIGGRGGDPNGPFGTGGTGGEISIQGGNGGYDDVGNNGYGGAGGNVELRGGQGGDGVEGDGDGGHLYLFGGNSGTTATDGSGSGGNVYVDGGFGFGGNPHGDVLMASNQGKVGIGNLSSPDTTLEVLGGICVSDNTSDNCTTGNGQIRADGDITANAFDLAELYPSNQNLAKGTIVSLDTSKNGYVKKAGAANTAIGIVSTDPGFVLGWRDNPSLAGAPHIAEVALAGRVPVKVTGPISRGDPITLSSTAGIGKKATQTSRIIGYALSSKTTSGTGTVEVFIQNEIWQAPLQNNQNTYLQNNDNATFANLNATGTTTLNGTLTVKQNATFDKDVLVKGKLTVNNDLIVKADLFVEGRLISRGAGVEATAQGALGQNAQVEVEGTDTAGALTLEPGLGVLDGDMVQVDFTKPYTNDPRILITAKNQDSAAIRWYVEALADNSGFVLKSLDTLQAGTTYQLDYFIIESEVVQQ